MDLKVQTVVLIPSYNCNMDCEYCYEGKEKNNSKIMSFKECEKIIEYLIKQNYNKINFILLGGEPIYVLHLKVFHYFFTKMKEYHINYEVSCVSNGLEISDKVNDILDLNIKHFQITLDGTEMIHNQRKKSKISKKTPFLEVCNSIDNLLNKDISVSLRINMDHENISELKYIGKIIKEHNWDKNKKFSSYLYPVTYSGNNEKNLRNRI